MNTEMAIPLIAQTDAPAHEGLPPPAGMGALGSMLPLILIFAILYFIMIRPAQRKEKERKKEIDQMRAGTKVLFSGGIIGVIKEVKTATFRIDVGDDITLEVARGAVQRVISGDEIPTTDDAR